ncbi:LysE family translocator [Negadavirga shengliensis]|uniref:LysE family translocator n=1 Tax=Negadavirga shengliensis TaxID=1389218 RepID=A0ABV9T5J2_9BACT
MNWAFLEGIGMGLVLSLIIGPVFFALIQNSLENGFRHSIFMAMGILLSDSLYVLISYFGVAFLAENPYFKVLLGYFGGLILIGFGVFSFVKKGMNRPSTGGIVPKKVRRRKGFFKGLGLNGINPFVLLFWISVAGLVNLKESYDSWDKTAYYLAVLLTVFVMDLFKAYVAQTLSKYITHSLMLKLNRIVAVLLMVFGVRLIGYAVNQHLLL